MAAICLFYGLGFHARQGTSPVATGLFRVGQVFNLVTFCRRSASIDCGRGTASISNGRGTGDEYIVFLGFGCVYPVASELTLTFTVGIENVGLALFVSSLTTCLATSA